MKDCSCLLLLPSSDRASNSGSGAASQVPLPGRLQCCHFHARWGGVVLSEF
jgi:hypothetical protein